MQTSYFPLALILCALCACGSSHNGAAEEGGDGATGSGSSGGSPGGGVDGSSDDGATVAPQHVVGSCTGLAAAGQWENISPPGLTTMAPYTGALMVVPDPTTSGTVYVGTSKNGMFKSTDCGATWTKTNTGRNGSQLDMGEIWSAVIDPIDSQTLYVLTGYGPSGLWKSTNGGVDWDNVLPSNMSFPGFVERVSIDPTNHLHVVTCFHENCTGSANPVCFAETKDGGMTWNVVNFPTALANMWAEGSSVLLIDSTHWIFEAWDIYFSPDEGTTWTKVTPGAAGDIQNQYFRTPDGTYYLTAANGIISSPDGQHWTQIANGPGGTDTIVGDGANLFAVVGFQPPSTATYVYTAPYSNTSSWSSLSTPGFPASANSGANDAAYDYDHHILYTAAQAEGLWRTVTMGSGDGGPAVGAADAAADSGDGAAEQ
jgi:hypothetical protein